MLTLLLLLIRDVPDLTISNLIRFRAEFFLITPDETNGVNNAVSCYEDPVQITV